MAMTKKKTLMEAKKVLKQTGRKDLQIEIVEYKTVPKKSSFRYNFRFKKKR